MKKDSYPIQLSSGSKGPRCVALVSIHKVIKGLHLDLLQQLNVVDADRWLPEQEPPMDLLVLLHLELPVVVVDVFRQVALLAEEGMGAERKRGLVVGHRLVFPFAKALGHPPKRVGSGNSKFEVFSMILSQIFLFQN